jgi:hypothetical protein
MLTHRYEDVVFTQICSRYYRDCCSLRLLSNQESWVQPAVRVFLGLLENLDLRSVVEGSS